ncbi:hypothetical protein RM863_35360 [Streptomyces sp. DSM 41014]|uniref:Uncharacterized protein n=1 Tax=Streptomyces hintoniae TaxID=3075521 RepID=A0ABU2UWL5_9ACTN|nr:hypothetical protein [Streptomyces sp. DSM 41014]MDT0477414.1 hypothetical protein [Streptomyces sp. DSM 41014]
MAATAELLGFAPVEIGAGALVAVIVLMILRGQLVPRRQVDDLLAVKDAQISELTTERDTWRQAHGVSEEARRESQDQSGELLELSRTAGYFFNALPRAAREVSTRVDVDQAPPT